MITECRVEGVTFYAPDDQRGRKEERELDSLVSVQLL